MVEIDEIVDRWIGDGYSYFKVADGSRNVYILRHVVEPDNWDLTLFQRATKMDVRGDGLDRGI